MLHRYLHHFSLLIIVIGMMLPSFGAWLGFNIAAIQPNHAHIYFGVNQHHHHDLFLDTILPHLHPEDVDTDAVVSVPTVDILSSIYSIYLLLFSTAILFGYKEILSCQLEHERGYVRLFDFSPPYPPPR